MPAEATYHCLECEFHTADADEMNDHIESDHPDTYGDVLSSIRIED